MRAAIGLAIVFAVLALVLSFVIFLMPVMSGARDNPAGANVRVQGRLQSCLFVAAILIACTFPVAIFTRKESRSDVADRFLESGSHHAGNDNPVARFLLTLAMIGILHGEYLLIDAIKNVSIRLRLRNVDRQRAAGILVTLFRNPAGINPRTLLQVGETPLQLRALLAYLIAHEWIEISAQGDYVNILSPARRALRN